MNLPADKSQLVWIVWKDAVGASTRAHVEDLASVGLVTNTNLGWILSENEERIVLAHGTSTTGEVDHFVIPVNCIVERIQVERPRRRSPSAKPRKRQPLHTSALGSPDREACTGHPDSESE